MRKYAVEYVKDAEKYLERLSDHLRDRIMKSIEEKLMVDPLRFSQPLSGKLKGVRRHRVGDYRVLFTIDRDRVVVFVIAMGHRKTVYDYAQRYMRYVCDGPNEEDGYWVFEKTPSEYEAMLAEENDETE